MFDNNGMLPAGMHRYALDIFEQDFIGAFPSSQTRKELFYLLGELLVEVQILLVPYEIWIDGSFATKKVNPNDIDIVMFLNYSDLQNEAVITGLTALKQKYIGNLDIYIALAVNEESRKALSDTDFGKCTNKRNYWRGQFGFDREDNPKGIIVLTEESLRDFTVGGQNNVTN